MRRFLPALGAAALCLALSPSAEARVYPVPILVDNEDDLRLLIQDGVLEPEDVARMVVETIRNENFLLLPHGQVATYMQRKATDPDRWIGGMQRFRSKLEAAGAYVVE